MAHVVIQHTVLGKLPLIGVLIAKILTQGLVSRGDHAQESVSSADEVIKVSLPFSIYHFLAFQFAEWLLEWAVLLCPVQGHEPYAVHRVWTPGPREYVWYLADHAEYDRGSHLLRHVHWSRHRPHTVVGLFPAPVPGEGGYYAPDTHTYTPKHLQMTFLCVTVCLILPDQSRYLSSVWEDETAQANYPYGWGFWVFSAIWSPSHLISCQSLPRL